MGQVRRQFLIGAGALFAAQLVTAHAQAPQHARVGILIAGSRNNVWFQLLPTALHERGWREGRNLTLEWRIADGRPERLPELASELVRLGVQVIVAPFNIEAEAAQRATRSIPIVMVTAIDPVGAGLAQSLAHPGGNLTGVQWADPTLSAKNMQILKELLPGMQRVGMLYPTGVVGIEPYLEAAEVAARALGVTFHRFPVTRLEDVGGALAAAKKERVDALRVTIAGVVSAAEAQVREFASSNRLPTTYTIPPPVERGGLLSYSSRISENAARAAALVDKILKGAKPADLPFEYPTRTEFVLNLKTAKQLGITVPQSVLLRADRVIE